MSIFKMEICYEKGLTGRGKLKTKSDPGYLLSRILFFINGRGVTCSFWMRTFSVI